ncbi:MAG TPA: hypothetical protein DCP73_05505, partial [Chloroflexi bacterium]|nr:hypothetical protein [Chloroflexota bacterium]
YPYAIPPGYGYWNKAEAMQQQAWANQQWQREQQQRERDFLWGTHTLEYGTRAAQLRLLKEQGRALRLQNDYRERTGNPLIDNNPFR